MAETPTQRSKRRLEAEGYTVAIVEHWHPVLKLRQDLFGFIDLLAIRRDETLAVQTTTTDHQAERIRKIADSPHVGAVREAGWAIHVHGWMKNAKGRWVLTVTDIS